MHRKNLIYIKNIESFWRKFYLSICIPFITIEFRNTESNLRRSIALAMASYVFSIAIFAENKIKLSVVKLYRQLKRCRNCQIQHAVLSAETESPAYLFRQCRLAYFDGSIASCFFPPHCWYIWRHGRGSLPAPFRTCSMSYQRWYRRRYYKCLSIRKLQQRFPAVIIPSVNKVFIFMTVLIGLSVMANVDLTKRFLWKNRTLSRLYRYWIIAFTLPMRKSRSLCSLLNSSNPWKYVFVRLRKALKNTEAYTYLG